MSVSHDRMGVGVHMHAIVKVLFFRNFASKVSVFYDVQLILMLAVRVVAANKN